MQHIPRVTRASTREILMGSLATVVKDAENSILMVSAEPLENAMGSLSYLNLSSVSFGRSEIAINGWRPPRPILGTVNTLIPISSQRRIKPPLLEPMVFAIEAKETYSL